MRLYSRANTIFFFFSVSITIINASWTPQNRFWKHIKDNQAGLLDEYDENDDQDQFQNIRSCLYNKLSKGNNNTSLVQEQQPFPTSILFKDEEESATQPVILHQLKDRNNHTVLVEIGNAIPPIHAKAIKDLAACIRTFTPSQFEHRAFDEGGNDCTFLQVVMQLFLPQVAANVYRMTQLGYETADWGGGSDNGSSGLRQEQQKQTTYPSPQTLGLRTTEYLNYRSFSHLDVHTDSGSLFTSLFALSDQYEGGEFYIQANDYEEDEEEEDGDDEDKYTFFKPKQYSVLVFLSSKWHGVHDIVSDSGVRETFANEFWTMEDPPWPWRRPDVDVMEYFMKQVESIDAEDYSHIDFNDLYPTDEELNEYLIEMGREPRYYNEDTEGYEEYEDYEGDDEHEEYYEGDEEEEYYGEDEEEYYDEDDEDGEEEYYDEDYEDGEEEYYDEEYEDGEEEYYDEDYEDGEEEYHDEDYEDGEEEYYEEGGEGDEEDYEEEF